MFPVGWFLAGHWSEHPMRTKYSPLQLCKHACISPWFLVYWRVTHGVSLVQDLLAGVHHLALQPTLRDAC